MSGGAECCTHLPIRGETEIPTKTPRTKAGKKAAMEQTMHEFKTGTLHSGSKRGPKVGR